MAAQKRSFFRVTEFQKPFLNLVIGLAVITLTMMVVCIGFLLYDVSTFIVDPQSTVNTMKAMVYLLLILLPLILMGGIFWAYYITSKVIGPFERLIRELDEILETGKKKHLQTRQGDRLAKEMLKRINALIDRMS